MTLADFCEVIAEREASHLDRALWILWWVDANERGREMTAGELVKTMVDHSLGAPNATNLAAGLKKSKKTISKNGKFKIRAQERASIGQLFIDTAVAVPVAAAEAPEKKDALPAIDFNKYNHNSQRIEKGPAKMDKPAVFIGSSVEGLEVAGAIAQLLEFSCETTVWSDNLIDLSRSTWESLCDVCGSFDFAILVLTPDDLVVKRGAESKAARDNVLLELGLFTGALGRNRVFVVVPRDGGVAIPTDLLGFTTAKYTSARKDGNMVAALHVAASQIKKAIEKAGPLLPD